VTSVKMLIAGTTVAAALMTGIPGVRAADETISVAEQKLPPSLADLTTAELQSRMAAGDLRAQAELGARYGRGDGVAVDVAKAITLLREAADKNDPDAQHWLGTAYATGTGVPKNEAQAALWYEKAALQGHGEAQYMMGVLISNGQAGFSQSWAGAFPYFWRSAERGVAQAELMLGVIYHLGHGVDANPEIAAYWYRRTNNRMRNLRAQFNLGLLIAQGRVAPMDGDPAVPTTDSTASQSD